MSQKDTIKKSSQIIIEVGLNEEKLPQKIAWKSTDDPGKKDFQEVKGILLSMFDKDYKDTLKIDLWTTEMQIAEMDRFMFQTLRALGDTYFRATANKELANDIQRFVEYFGKQTGIIREEQ